MTKLEAIDERRSRRLYLDKPIEASHLSKIKELIAQYNDEYQLAIRFVEDGSGAFSSFRKSYGLFSGVRNLLVLAGSKTDPNLKEKAGYCGEMLVLEATMLGLGTCWVGGTFDTKNDVFQLTSDEALVCVIPIGHVESLSFKEKMVHQMIAGKSKSIEQLMISDAKIPSQYLEAMKAVQKAPSAAYRQPVRFDFKKGTLTVYTEDDGKLNLVDLGIVKAHFEIATGGQFERGNPARFLPGKPA
ncbi:MAG TPA: nitroreductase family protein [Bacteroidales bacterium]|nr:nitroreductase family protein [Bacteroidales bacterium]